MCCFAHIKRNGNLFFTQSQRPHTLDEKHDIWQEAKFSRGLKPLWKYISAWLNYRPEQAQFGLDRASQLGVSKMLLVWV